VARKIAARAERFLVNMATPGRPTPPYRNCNVTRAPCHGESGGRHVLTTISPTKAHTVILSPHSLSSHLPVKHRSLVLSLVKISGLNVGAFSCKLSATTADRFSIGQMTIDILPDEALLEIFSFYLVEASRVIEPWLPLVHVCRRWRSVVFASPLRLDVRVFYTPNRRVKAMLDIWLNLPIIISSYEYTASPWHGDNNLIAALEHTDRICQIHLTQFPCFEFERILAAMQKPFPALTSLDIDCSNQSYLEAMAVLPEAFLGGSAQHLRSCRLSAVEFPGIWKLLL